ncbi:hypothetical protein BK120_22990 [Paenibacillus sp. FSL A5-0031]|uniref:hypothetical protein n=1 Tax=Paenibacillus sp. FSL A5-0031 TaxID=1920420 RepID=UPI00097015FD|nr:hypothetical protein [Paenibacillus sp. FSL A5-0031]OME78607.1 hypothetical protein BK120_22990 [Paenibacillus sp. FSL A5-0031]
MVKLNKITLFLLVVIVGAIFSTASASAATAIKTATTSYQYGAAAFDPKKTYSQISSKDLNVQEKGDYTIVTWSDQSSLDGTHLYMSVAKKNKWLFRGKEVLYVDDAYNSFSTMITVANNYIFYGNNEHLAVKIVNLDDGKTISEKTLQTWKDANIFTSNYFYPIRTNDRSGVLYENGVGKYTIYLEGELAKPLTIEDPKNVLRNQLMSKFRPIVLTTKRDRLIFSTWLGSTVYNINKKDMSYDETGQVKNYPGTLFYAGGKFYNYISSTNPTIQSLDENFKTLSTTLFKDTSKNLTSGTATVGSGNVVRFWSYNNYQNTNSLQVTSFNLSK